MAGMAHDGRTFAGGFSRRYSVPVATYRLQLHSGFRFEHVQLLLPYLEALGVSHLYLSPIFEAAPGSTHGYDVLNHNRVNPELGGLPALYELGAEMMRRDLGLVLDIVPNHVGIAGGTNPWWEDVLRYGPASRYAQHFDIDWGASGVLVYPVLGKPFGAALESGEIRLELVGGEPRVRYYEHSFPLAPDTYPDVIRLPPVSLGSKTSHPRSLPDLIEILQSLPEASREEAETALGRMREILTSEPAMREHVERGLEELNGKVGDPESFDQLDAVLSEQRYRLAYWRVSAEEINYRRFFDINDLAAIRQEREEVFEETHRLLFELVARGIVTGVRVDHVDGLNDPGGYLGRLSSRLREAAGGRGVPIYVEKVLEPGERLPRDWPVAGTTGYDFMSRNDGLMIDRESARALTETYERVTGRSDRFRDVVYRSKRLIEDTSFSGEISVLAGELHRMARRHRSHRDDTLRSLRHAIEATLACFPVYRTYVSEEPSDFGEEEYIEEAIAEVRRREPGIPSDALGFLEEVLLLREAEPEEMARRAAFRRRFEQLSSPIMAKGFEDTALYRYNRLVSLNEVGNDPSTFGAPPRQVHAWLEERARDWPHALSASSTHDTKRGEDVRARLHVLSQVPREWRGEVRAWAGLNARYRSTLYGDPVPGPNTEYLIYQTLVGTWPEGGRVDGEYRERLHAYLTKALREAKAQTSWLLPDERFESACHDFLTAILDTRRSRAFQRRLTAFCERISLSGRLNSLSELVIKATAPGVPDFYQGEELWDDSLTDPDNRRHVDFALREQLLAGLTDVPTADLSEPSAKLWLTHRLLALRARALELFASGSYEPLEVEGERAEHAFAFARERGGRWVAVVVPRLTYWMTEPPGGVPLGIPAWRDTRVRLPAGVADWHDGLTGRVVAADREVRLGDLLEALPFAVLLSVHEG